MNRFTKVEAIKFRDELIPLFMLKAEIDDDYDKDMEVVLSNGSHTFTCDETVECLYDLLEKKIVSPSTREVTVLIERTGSFSIGDKVAVEKGIRSVYIDTIKDIVPGRLEFTSYFSKERINNPSFAKDNNIIKDEGDKNASLVKVNYLAKKYILEGGEVIEYDHKINKIVDK